MPNQDDLIAEAQALLAKIKKDNGSLTADSKDITAEFNQTLAGTEEKLSQAESQIAIQAENALDDMEKLEEKNIE